MNSSSSKTPGWRQDNYHQINHNDTSQERRARRRRTSLFWENNNHDHQHHRRQQQQKKQDTTLMTSTSTIGALHPGNYSTAQQAVSYVATALAGSLSLLGSLVLVYYISSKRRHLRHHQHKQDKKSSLDQKSRHHKHPPKQQQRVHPKIAAPIQLVFVWALVNMVTSFLLILRDGFVPVDFPDYWWNNSGTTTACRVQAFWQHVQVTSNALYSTCLAGYFVWTMALGHRFTHKMMRWSHVLALGFPLGTAAVALLLRDDVFNPSVTTACYFADAPLGCHRNNDDGQACSGSHAYVVAWIVTLVPLLTCVVAQTVAVVHLGLYIRHLYQVIAEMARNAQKRQFQKKTSSFEVDLSESNTNKDASERSHSSRHSGRHHRHSPHQVQERLTRMKQFVQIEQEGFLTVLLNLCALILSNFFLVICLLVDQFRSPHEAPPYGLRFFHSLLFPLQGFWNCVIFLRPRIVAYRRQHAEIMLRKLEQENDGDEDDVIQEMTANTKMSYLEATKCVLVHKPHPHSHLLHSQNPGPNPVKASKPKIAQEEAPAMTPAMTPKQKQLNPASYMTSQRHLQPQQQQEQLGDHSHRSTGGRRKPPVTGPAWSQTDEKQARQLARAMSSRQGLQEAAQNQNNDKMVRRLAQTMSTRRMMAGAGNDKDKNPTTVNKMNGKDAIDEEGPAASKQFARRPPTNPRVLATMESGKSFHDPGIEEEASDHGETGILARTGQEVAEASSASSDEGEAVVAASEPKRPQQQQQGEFEAQQEVDDQDVAAISAAAAAVSTLSPDGLEGLEGNTYHGTRREHRASVSSWSKLDTSSHQFSTPLQQERQPRAHRTRGSLNSISTMESTDSFHLGGDTPEWSTDFAVDRVPLPPPHSRASSMDTFGDGLDDEDMNQSDGGGQQQSMTREENIPLGISTASNDDEPVSPLGKILADKQMSSWSSFSTTDLVLPLEVDDAADGEGKTDNSAPGPQPSANLQATAALMGQRAEDQAVDEDAEHDNPNHLASVLEGDFEDSREFSTSSDLDLLPEGSDGEPRRRFDLSREKNLRHEEEHPDPRQRGASRMPSWAAMSATDMLNQPAPDMAGMFAPRSRQGSSSSDLGPQRKAAAGQSSLGSSSSHSETASWSDHISANGSSEFARDLTTQRHTAQSPSNRASGTSLHSLRAVKEHDKEDESTNFAEDTGADYSVREIPMVHANNGDEGGTGNSESSVQLSSEGHFPDETRGSMRGSSKMKSSIASRHSQTSNVSSNPSSWALLGDSDQGGSSTTLSLASGTQDGVR